MTKDEDFSPNQKEAIEELRTRMEKDIPAKFYEDDIIFYRFLKARNFNVGHAESMLRKNLDFRKSLQLDTIQEDYKVPEFVKRYATSSILGFDKEGSIVRFLPIGNIDGKGVFRSINKIHVLKNTLQLLERDLQIIKQQSQIHGRRWLAIMLIVDVENLTLAKITDKTSLANFIHGITVFQDNYPEILKSIYVINASTTFTMIFPIIKKILVGPIVEKLHVFGRDGWQEEFRRLVDSDVLPVPLGGTKTDPDGNPMCKTTVNWSGDVPVKYHLTKNIGRFASQPGVRKAIVSRRSTHEVSIEVRNANTKLEWEFELKNADIGVRVQLIELHSDSTEVTEIITSYIFDTENEPLKGMLRCEVPGIYVIIFDNKHSWFQSKEVYYKVWLSNSDEKKNRRQQKSFQKSPE